LARAVPGDRNARAVVEVDVDVGHVASAAILPGDFIDVADFRLHQQTILAAMRIVRPRSKKSLTPIQADFTTDLISGQIQIRFEALPASIEYIRAATPLRTGDDSGHTAPRSCQSCRAWPR
jgi:hypothetical protein